MLFLWGFSSSICFFVISEVAGVFFRQHHSLNKCGKIEHFHFWECLWNCWTCHQVAPLNKCLLLWNLDLPDMMSFVVFFEQTFYTCGRSWQIHFLFKCSKEFGIWFTGLPKIDQWLKWFQLMEKYILVPRSGENRWKYVPLKSVAIYWILDSLDIFTVNENKWPSISTETENKKRAILTYSVAMTVEFGGLGGKNDWALCPCYPSILLDLFLMTWATINLVPLDFGLFWEKWFSKISYKFKQRKTWSIWVQLKDVELYLPLFVFSLVFWYKSAT